MSSWSRRMLSLAVPLAMLAPQGAGAATAQPVAPQPVMVVSGHALVGASPRFVKLSCALDHPLVASSARLSYGPSANPGRGGTVAHIVPAMDALNAYGVAVNTPLSGLTTLSVMADGRHGPSLPVVQYPTSGGAVMVGGLSTFNSGIGWATFKGLGQPLNWVRYANGVATAQGPATVAAIAARYPATGVATAGVVFGCDNGDHDFEVDDLVVGTTASARAYDFETAVVAAHISLVSPRKTHATRRVTLRGALAPAAAGIPIGVYRVKHGKRHLIRAVRTDGAGRFKLRTSFKRAGKVLWSATVLPKQHWVTGASGTRRLTVVRAPRPKPKPKHEAAHHPTAVGHPSSGGTAPGGTVSGGTVSGGSTSTQPGGCSAVICSG